MPAQGHEERDVHQGEILRFSLMGSVQSAKDDDNSRSGGWSAVYTVDVREGLFHIYLPLVMRGDE